MLRTSKPDVPFYISRVMGLINHSFKRMKPIPHKEGGRTSKHSSNSFKKHRECPKNAFLPCREDQGDGNQADFTCPMEKEIFNKLIPIM